MAVILRNSAPRNTTATSSTIIRHATIKIAQTGLIESLSGPDNKSVSVLNLGYKGDHNVTQLRVKLWTDSTANFANRYEAAIVFYNEKLNSSYTASMERIDDYYYVNIPDAVTKDSGNYQMNFLLKESMSRSITLGGNVGVEDDPAYREVFVSAVWKGAVSEQSGCSLLYEGFTWEDGLYNYERGRITPHRWDPETDSETGEETGNYISTTFLSGLKSNATEEDIHFEKLPSIISVKHISLETIQNVTGRNLVLTIQFAGQNTEEEENKALDELVVSYPVTFDVSSFNESNALHKEAILVNYSANSISVKDNENLGMKYDAYITPINVSGLPKFSNNTKKYVIFAKNGQSLVCEAFGNYCWIPASVTADVGVWHVSFVVKDTVDEKDYVCYTGILKLPVLDNKLSKRDLQTDTSYRALIDNDGQTLYDENNYALYAITDRDSTATLSVSASEIEYAVGWVNNIRTVGMLGSDDIIQAVGDLKDLEEKCDEEWEKISNLQETASGLNTRVGDLETSVGSINTEIQGIQDRIETLDVVALQSTVEQHTEDIESLQEKDTTIESNINNLSTKINNLETKDVDLQGQINSNAKNISSLEEEKEALKARTTTLETRADLSANTQETMGRQIGTLTDRVSLVESGLQSQSSLLIAETERAIIKEDEIADNLQDEINRSTGKDDELENKIIDENERAVLAEENLQTQINDETTRVNAKFDTLDGNITDINTNISKINDNNATQETNIQGLLTDVNAIKQDETIIRNDYLGEPKIFVKQIVFLDSEEEYNALETKTAGTLYLIREE